MNSVTANLDTSSFDTPSPKTHNHSAPSSTWGHCWNHLTNIPSLLKQTVTSICNAFYAPMVTLTVSHPTKSPWQPRALPIDVAMQKMWKNAKKAIEEHEGKEEIYASPEESLPPMALLVDAAPLTPLQLIHHVAEAQGVRDTMEDAHFFKEIEQGTITGILDGHGGSAVATHASTLFQEKFSAALTKAQGNVHEAFETVIHEIHEDIASHRNWDKIGSTAVLSFIDKNTHLIYTATLGDSEANVYRKIDGELKSIPLSCVRDWSSRKDAQRAAIALNRPKIAKQWPLIHPKVLRFPSSRYGVNVSRAFGDVDLTGTVEHPGVIHKPKITVNQLKPGDTLILACDGLKDYVSETTIAALLALPFPEEDTSTIAAALLVNYALLSSRDNISVMAIKVT